MNLKELYDLNYWFTIRPGEMSAPFLVGFFIFFLIVFLGTFALIAYKRKNKVAINKPERKLYEKIQSACATMGLLGLLWLFFAYERVPFLSARFWVLVLILSIGLWIYVISRYYTLDMKPQIKKLAEKERIEKWLPKNSNR